MLTFLGWIVQAVEYIPLYALWALEMAFNGWSDAVTLVVAGLFALLPSMGDSAAIGTPTWLHWLNWIYPVGPMLTALTAAVGMWVTFLVVRWGLKLLRAL